MSRILVFGCGELQESLIKNAKKLKHFVVGIDIDPDAIAKALCDKFYVVEGNDFAGTCRIIEQYKIDGIVTAGTEKPLEMMARISEKYQLPFPTPEAIRNTTYKHLLKEILTKRSIPTAKSYLFNGLTNKKKLPKLKYPVIVKPVDNSGSRGVIYCETPGKLKKGMKEALSFSPTKKILVEEYIGGKEYSVESLVYRNKVTLVSITEKIVTPHPYNVELGHIQPAELNAITTQKITKTVEKLIWSLGLNDCACHTEIKMFRGIAYVIENGARLGGDYITSDLTPLSAGINMEREVIRIALGKRPAGSSAKMRSSCIRYFNFGKGTVQYNAGSLNAIKDKGLVKIKLSLKTGQKIPEIKNSLSRYGFIIVKGKDRTSAIMAMNTIYKKVLDKIHVKR